MREPGKTAIGYHCGKGKIEGYQSNDALYATIDALLLLSYGDDIAYDILSAWPNLTPIR